MRKILFMLGIFYICSVICVFFVSVYIMMPKEYSLEYNIFPYPHVKLKKFQFYEEGWQETEKCIELVEIDDARVEMTVYSLFFVPKFLMVIKNVDLYLKSNQSYDFLFSVPKIFNYNCEIKDLNIFYKEDIALSMSIDTKQVKGTSLLQVNNFSKIGNNYDFILNSKLQVNCRYDFEHIDLMVEDDNINGSFNFEFEGKQLLLAKYNLQVSDLHSFLLDYFNISFDQKGKVVLKGDFNYSKYTLDVSSNWLKGIFKVKNSKVKGVLEYAQLDELMKLLYLSKMSDKINLKCGRLIFDKFDLADVYVDLKANTSRKGDHFYVNEINGSIMEGVNLTGKGVLYIKNEDIPSFKGQIILQDVSNYILSRNLNINIDAKVNNKEYIFDNIRIDGIEGDTKINVNPLANKLYISSKLKTFDLIELNRSNVLNSLLHFDYFINFKVSINNLIFKGRKFNKFKALGVFDNIENAWKVDNLLIQDDLNQYLLSLKIANDLYDVKVIDAQVRMEEDLFLLRSIDNLKLSGYVSSVTYAGNNYDDVYVDLLKDKEFIQVNRLDFMSLFGYFKFKGECDISALQYQFHYNISDIELNKYFNLLYGCMGIKGGAVTSGGDLVECIQNLKSKGSMFFKGAKLKIMLHDFIKDMRSNGYSLKDFHDAVANVESDAYINLEDIHTDFRIKEGEMRVKSIPLVTDYIYGNLSGNFDFNKDFVNLFGRCSFYMEPGKEDSLYNFKLFITGAKKNLGYNIKFDHHVIRLLFQRYFSQNLN